MSPNAIQNSKDQQIKQAEQIRDRMKVARDLADKQVDLLDAAVARIESIGTVPSFSDVRKLADALKYSFQSQLISAVSVRDDAQKNYEDIISALKVAQSPIHTASRIIP